MYGREGQRRREGWEGGEGGVEGKGGERGWGGEGGKAAGRQGCKEEREGGEPEINRTDQRLNIAKHNP